MSLNFDKFPGEFPLKIDFLGIAKKNVVEEVCGGPPTEQKQRRLCCSSRQNSRYGVSSPPPLLPLMLVSCVYLLVNLCSFLFPSRKGQIQHQFGEKAQTCVFETNRACKHCLPRNAVAWFSSDSLCMFRVMVKISS